jgi:hypothetical protein
VIPPPAVVLDVVLIVTHDWSTDRVNGNGPVVVSLTKTLCVTAAPPTGTENDNDVGFVKIT